MTEYACHVRDVHDLFRHRVQAVLDQDEPRFANWDQDAVAAERRYDLADPAAVAAELSSAAEQVAGRYEAVAGTAWDRTGVRGDGRVFTVASLARYHLHDVVHHIWDVRTQLTLAAYDADAAAYREATVALTEPVRAAVDDFADRLPEQARVLEIGSGGGRDALALEERGVRVRRTDVTRGFVDRLRADGHRADVLDPLRDELLDETGRRYDGIWANASLLHVARADLPTVLERLAEATEPGGVLRMTLKEGDGAGWSTHGSIRAPRMFTYWREPALRSVAEQAGWRVDRVQRGEVGQRGERWLDVVAYRGCP
ncbi:class I SAM-dependent methyltransferase [Nocardioides sp. GXZ039]|uniref:class I SAM-dependent methyltransferase n=1 Tax=Nocardioides sp. GXZ039 TaxID=3136018 RepID=UPI0030F45847